MDKKTSSTAAHKRDSRGRFEKGHKKLGGRTLGTPNRLTQVTAQISILEGMGDLDGIAVYVQRLADENPRLTAGLICKIARIMAEDLPPIPPRAVIEYLKEHSNN